MAPSPRKLLDATYQLPWIYLGLYACTIGLIGWSLSLFFVIIYGISGITLLALYLSVKRQAWLHGLFGRAPQVLSIVLILSLSLTSFVAFPILILLILLPLLSIILAWQEMRFRHYSLWVIYSIMVTLGGLSLTLGELIDLYIFPSPLYR